MKLNNVLCRLLLLILAPFQNIFTVETLSISERIAGLQEIIFENYSTSIDRPLKVDRVMTLFRDLAVFQILEASSKDQNIQLRIQVIDSWEDDYLFWDPANHHGISSIHVASDKVWTPDTYLSNSLDMDSDETERDMPVVLRPEIASNRSRAKHNTTWVTRSFPAIYRSACQMNMMHFPWDQHNCSLVFTSWTYTNKSVNYSTILDKVDLWAFTENQEFRLVAFKPVWVNRCMYEPQPRDGNEYNCYNQLWFLIIIRRRALYYVVNLIIPAFVLTLICFVEFFSVSSSSGERSEKVSVGIAGISSLFIILLVTADHMPTTSLFIPMIAWYYLSLMMLISMALLTTKLILYLHKRGLDGKGVPGWLGYLIQIPKQLETIVEEEKLLQKFRPMFKQKKTTSWANMLDFKTVVVSNDLGETDDEDLPGSNGLCESPSSRRTNAEFRTSEIHQLQQTLNGLKDYLKSKERVQEISNEWRRSLNGLEKALFCVFTFLCCAATVTLVLYGYILPDYENE